MDEGLAVPLIRRDSVSSNLTTISSACSAQSDSLEALTTASPPPLPFPLSKHPSTCFSCLPSWSKCCFNTYSIKSVLLVLLAIQGSSAIVIGRYTRFSAPEEELYDISHLVLVIECVKFLLSIFAECISAEGNLWESVQKHIFKRPFDSCKVLVPAILYVIQNSLVYIALSNLSAPVFISLQQGKLIATAVVSAMMLRRTYSLQQWACLFVLAVGVAIVALDENRGDSQGTSQNRSEDIDVSGVVVDSVADHEQYFVVGIVAVTGACFSSAFAGVYFEMVLAPEKAVRTIPDENTTITTPAGPPVTTPTSVGPSLWIRNIQLAFFSILFCIAQGAWESRIELQIANMKFDDDEVVDNSSLDQGEDPKPFFHGFTAWVWVLVILQAGGGLLVAAVMKWADNVLKGLAMGIGVVVASLISTVLFNVKLSPQFALGACIICSSVYCFSNDFRCFQMYCMARGNHNQSQDKRAHPMMVSV